MMNKILKALAYLSPFGKKALLDELVRLRQQLAAKDRGILDKYVTDAPSPDAAFKIFDNLWSSNIPGYGYGKSALFEDGRIDFFIKSCGGVTNKRVLELGPLEAGHTYMLSQAGAASITSIESNTTAFLKCLVVQNVFKFEADFVLGDFRPYLDQCTEKFDLVVASGVLYHMLDPVKLLCDMCKVSDSIGLWTHYYDAEVILGREDLKRKFDAQPKLIALNGRNIVSYEQRYLEALQWGGFCGGSAPSSCWLTKDSIAGLLTDLGFAVEVVGDHADHPNGPAMTLFAQRKASAPAAV